MNDSNSRRLLHGWVVFLAGLTFVLLCSGGLVTSLGAGLTVPDWPNSFGYNMFEFPVSRWVSGIFYEHSHRLIATFVGLFTAVMAVWMWVLDSRREDRWPGVVAVVLVIVLLGVRQMPVYLALATLSVGMIVVCAFLYRNDGGRLRWLGMAALAAVVLQGVLGGIRVVWLRDEIGIFHGLLAQSFFVFLGVLAVMTGRRFREGRWAEYEPDRALRWGAVAATGLIFLQLGVGATMRHEHIGLSIPDFPLAYGRVLPDTGAEAVARINEARVADGRMPTNAVHIWVQMAHRFIAVVIVVAVIRFVWLARRSTRAIRRWSLVWATMIVCQVALGAWTIWSDKAADVATTHMALGALSLLTGALVSFRLICGGKSADFASPDVPKSRLMEKIA